MLIEWVSITFICKKYNTCEISRVCNNQCLLLKGQRDHAWLWLTYFDFDLEMDLIGISLIGTDDFIRKIEFFE